METIILVHGVGLWGTEMFLLKYRLRKLGYNCQQFYYSTRYKNLAENAAILQNFLLSKSEDTIHFVGHSLGGLLISQFFQDYPQKSSGRIVLLGTPWRGSEIARRLSQRKLGKFLLGKSVISGLSQRLLPPLDRDVGVIAGSLDIGTGFLLGVSRPNDSLISVKETYLPEIKEHIVLQVSHSSLLLSAKVSLFIHTFLQTGNFS
ncbi:lipase family alpha/beta hydrolase [Dapis sp. BLCC M126]|uniref:lipase family alpha/beta hydrolase n=1 Tax=Dapis sp. BLCC M126 TaxID=3400189 RepID=UPI003CEDFB53